MRKIICILTALTVFVSLFSFAAFAETEKKPVTVVIPENCASTVSYAAQTLKEYLSPLCSVVVIIPENAEADASGAVIHIGQTKAALSSASDMTDGSYVIKSHDGIIEINGGGTHGNIYGVFRFLKEYCGYNCYTSALGMKTEMTELELPESIDIEYTAFFRYTETDWVSPGDPLYSLANGLNGNTYRVLTPEQGGTTGYISSLCHTLTGQFCSKDTYFAEHPEYFALVDGERKDSQLCLSNEDVYKIVLDEVFALLKEKHDPEAALQIVSLTQADNRDYCTCENCKAIDDANGSPAGSMITFVNKIAKEVKAAGYDNVMIDTFAYQYTRHTPSAVIPEDNVIVRLCTIECCFVHSLDDTDCPENASLMEDLGGWGRIAKNISIWDYTTNYAYTFGVFPDFNVIQRNMQIFYENSAIGVYEEGAYYMNQCNTEFGELRSYLLSRLMLDPYCDLDAETLGFCKAYYGEGGEYIAEFLSKICEYAARKHSGIYSSMKNVFEISKKEAKELDGLFEKAKEAAADETCLENIKRSELSWRYVKSSLGLCEFGGIKLNENKKLFADLKNSGATMKSEGTEFKDVKDIMFLSGADAWYSSSLETVPSVAVGIVSIIIALVCAIICLKKKNKKLPAVICLLAASVCQFISAELYIPWNKMVLFGILAGGCILAAVFAGAFMSVADKAPRKKAALTAVAYGVIYAAVYWLPIVIINVIISGGSRNAPSMLVSTILCTLFTAAASVRAAK